MTSTLAAADAVLKIGYGDIHEQLESRIVALQLVERGSKHIVKGSKEAQFAVHTGRTWGVGSRNEMEDLPAPGANTDARASVFLKYHYGSIQGSGQTFKQVHTDYQGFVDWMSREVSGIIETMQRDGNRQVYGDGTGTIALLTAQATTATTLTVDSVLWFEKNQTLDVLTQATLGNPVPTRGNTDLLKVVGIDPVASTITVTGGTVTAAIGSAVVLASKVGSTITNNWKKELEGLGLIISSQPLHNINPSTEPEWLPGYVKTGQGTLTEMAITALVQGIHREGGNVTDFLTTYGVANAYWNTLQGQRRFDGREGLKGGATVPVFQSLVGDIPFSLDWLAPKGSLYALNKPEMFMNEIGGYDWLDMDGSKWKQVPYKEAWIAHVARYRNLGVYRRNSFGKITGITEVTN